MSMIEKVKEWWERRKLEFEIGTARGQVIIQERKEKKNKADPDPKTPDSKL